ncbi:MAG: hypothetical protein FJ096_10620 [Deltaproteobacteria bacterium]|nr:hypothetical protein [Deltaproteobacteria bacterium]
MLDRLAVELAERRRRTPSEARPLGVIVGAVDGASHERGDAVLDAVDEVASRSGARPGQTAAAAAAYAGPLEVVHLARSALTEALAGVAEVGLSFAPLAGLELDVFDPPPFVRYPTGRAAGPLDTVWLDVTGCTRLTGGDDILCAELRAKVAELGHHARVAVADGPRIARALARWGGVESVAPPGEGSAALADLPVACLPLDGPLVSWLGEVGIWTVGELTRIERRRMTHRLGPRAGDVLALAEGRDDVPLRPYSPPRCVVEQVGFEEPLENQEPLLFVLRGMVARAATRLAARGEAAGRATLELAHDRAALAIAAREGRALQALVTLDLGLPVPLAREDDLLRAMRSRVERLEVEAPIATAQLRLDDLTKRNESQLDLSNLSAANPDALPTLLAELVATVGPTRVGILAVTDSHRPEARSACIPVPHAAQARTTSPHPRSRRSAPDHARHDSTPSTGASSPPPGDVGPASGSMLALGNEPTRLLPEPLCIGSLRPGALVGTGRTLYVVEHLRLAARLEDVEWWTVSPVSRDYARVKLRTGLSATQHEHAEAWVFVDRLTGRAFLHGWFE